MNLVYNILVAIAVIIAIAFSLLVLVTGKGDAMSGGGSVRTTFKGKASFDDIMSKWTLYIGVAFMAIVLIINIVAKRLDAPVIIDRSVNVTNEGSNLPTNTGSGTAAPIVTPTLPGNAPTNPPPTNVPPAVTPPTSNGVGATGTSTSPPANGPLDSTPATVPSANNPVSGSSQGGSSQPSVVPSIPGTTTGGAANAAPPVGNR